MRRPSIRTTLLLLVAAASVPLVATALYNAWTDFREAEAETNRVLEALARDTVESTAPRLDRLRHALETLAVGLGQAPPPPCEPMLRQFLGGCSHCLEVTASTPGGPVTCRATQSEGRAPSPLLLEPSETTRPRGTLGLSRPVDDPATGEPVLVMTFEHAELTLRALLRLDVLDPGISLVSLPPEARVGFFSTDGVLIWRRPDPEKLNGKPMAATSSRWLLGQGDGLQRGMGIDGRPRRAWLVSMPEAGWKAFVGVPSSWVPERARDRGRDTMITTLAAILLMITIAVVVARRIAQPVVQLERLARVARQGDLHLEAQVGGPRELAAVVEALNALMAARLQHEHELRAFLENSSVIAWMKDAEGRYTFASNNLLARFAFTREGLLGKTDRDLWPPELAEQFRGLDLQVLSGGVAPEYVQHIPNPDGTRSAWLTRRFRFDGPGGEPRVGGLAVDITLLEQAEAARRLSDEQLDKAFRASPIGMALVTLEGRFMRVNPALTRMLGWTEAEFLGTTREALTPAGDRERERTPLEELAAGRRESWEGEKHYLKRDGSPLWVQVNAFVVRDARGQPLHLVEQVQDVSERKRAEASGRLAVVGTLAAGAAHEINNPLTYVLGNLSWARKELGAFVPELPPSKASRLVETVAALGEAHEGAERIAAIVRGLKASARKHNDELAPTDVVAAMESALRLTASHRRNQARTVTRFGPVPKVRANDRQLEQVFINLLVNAVQAIPEGDPDRHAITVTVQTTPAGEVAAEVQDTGAGISDEVMPHLFEPFFTTKPVGAGTGLGLSTCHGIVTSFGGRIEVKSKVGEGSCFRVVLAGLPEEARPARSPAQLEEVTLEKGRRVLIIDDEPTVTRSLARALSDGPEVVLATQPREALGLLERETFDLVLCDVMMPGVSGEELQRQLAQHQPKLAESMIFLTGGAFTPTASAFLAQTKNVCLYKPVERATLRRAVADGLARAAANAADS